LGLLLLLLLHSLRSDLHIFPSPFFLGHPTAHLPPFFSYGSSLFCVGKRKNVFSGYVEDDGVWIKVTRVLFFRGSSTWVV
jgi:hypothetical protein